jgi:hypothetical protein
MYKRLVVAALILSLGLFLYVSAASAAEQENKVVKFFKRLINWPVNITKNEAQTVGKTAEKSLTTVTKTTASTVDTLTGKPEKAKDIIIEPVKGTIDTATTAVVGTVEAPVEGTKETFEDKDPQP